MKVDLTVASRSMAVGSLAAPYVRPPPARSRWRPGSLLAAVADVAAADGWHDRWSFLLRRPGWAYARRPAAGVA